MDKYDGKYVYFPKTNVMYVLKYNQRNEMYGYKKVLGSPARGYVRPEDVLGCGDYKGVILSSFILYLYNLSPKSCDDKS